MAEKSNMAVIATFFGRKPGQTLAEFVEECKPLTDADKQELGDAIRAHNADQS